MELALGLPALFLVGLVAGILNVLAGGGSFLTLPLLIFLGVTPGVANGTNRVGILFQNLAAVRSFSRQDLLPAGSWRWAALPALLGAGLGTWWALEVSDQAFRRVLAVLMVVGFLWVLWGPRPEPGSGARPAGRGPRWALGLGFFAAGVYGGFVQAGVGFLLLALTSLAGLDLVRGNAVKVLTVLVFTVLSLGLFALHGRVAWILGVSLGLGMMVGGALGARLAVRQGHAWLRGFVSVVAVLFALQLWIGAR